MRFSPRLANLSKSTNPTKSTNLSKPIAKKFIPSYNFAYNADKDLFNAKVCAAMRKQNSRNVLMCDGTQERSIRACESIGIPRHRMTTIERDPDVSKAHRKSGVNSLNMEAHEVFADPNCYSTYDAINLDVVSAPQTIGKYIGNIFANGFLSKKSVLAITATKRTGKSGGKFEPKYLRLKKLIQQHAQTHGFKCQIDSEHTQLKVLSTVFVLSK